MVATSVFHRVLNVFPEILQVAYSMLKGGDEGEDPVDAHYKKLKTEIVPLERTDQEYKRLVDYVSNTHAETHNMYELEVEEVCIVLLLIHPI